MTNVLTAFLTAGFFKLGIAFEIASTPVNAEQPDENAFNNINNVISGTAETLTATVRI